MELRHSYELEVNSDCSETVRYSYTDIPIGFFSGRFSAYPNASVPTHWHEDIELIVPNEREAVYNINGKLVTVRSGEGLLINSRRLHSARLKDIRDCCYNLLIFHPMILCISEDIEKNAVQPIINSTFDYILLQKGTTWHENILHWFSIIRKRHIDKAMPKAFAPIEYSVLKDNQDNSEKAGKFDLILTKEVSRFARNTVDSLTYTRDLLRAGVGVFFQNDNICTIDTDSELRLTIMSSIAADEVRKLSERAKWGHNSRSNTFPKCMLHNQAVMQHFSFYYNS